MTNEEVVFRLFRSINSSLMNHMNHLCSAYDLTGVQCLIMMELRSDEVNISELAERTMMKTSNISSIVKRMESRGLVQRKRSSQDERIVYVSLRQDALDKIRSMMEQDLVDSLFHELDDEQITEILNALKLLDACIRRCEHE